MIINIVNSIIGKKGNIGLRTSYIIDELNRINIENFSYSRGAINTLNNKNMGILGHIPRILNAIRIYINLLYNHRKHDIWLFEFWFKLVFKENEQNSKKIVHIWEYCPNIIKMLQAKGYQVILDVPIAPTSTSQDLIKKFNNIITLHPHEYNSFLEKQSFALVDHIITPSKFVKEEIVKLGIKDEKISVVPFGADINISYEKRFDKDYENNGIDFCFAGTINKRKGLEFLLEAWNDKRFENDRLHLCGRLFPEIDKILSSYRFKNVLTPGFVDTKDYFKKCDVYIFPSLLEGSSKSTYEAMNMSLPCIVTPNSGSIIEDNVDGFIIEIASSDSIKKTMLKFKESPDLIEKMGKLGNEKIKNYSWEHYAKNVCEIYKRIMI